MKYTKLEGMNDCMAGVPHQEGKGNAYDEGYWVQYQLDQLQSENTFNQLWAEMEKRERQELANEI